MQNIHSSQEKLLVQWYLERLSQWDFWDDDHILCSMVTPEGPEHYLDQFALVARVLYSQTTDLRSFYGLISMVGGYIYIHMYNNMYIYIYLFIYAYIYVNIYLCNLFPVFIYIYIFVYLNQTIQDVFKSSLILPQKGKRRQRCFLSRLLRSACFRQAEITGGGEGSDAWDSSNEVTEWMIRDVKRTPSILGSFRIQFFNE